jgi:subtilase family serine protease
MRPNHQVSTEAGQLQLQYDAQPLLDAGYTGYNQTIAFLEYSSYYASDISTFKSCFGLTTPVYNVPVGGGTSDTSNNSEDELDVEEAMAAAPHLAAAYMYTAPQTVTMAGIINQVVSDQTTTDVHVLSISWGLCEPYMSGADLSAESSALQLGAASGISVYVASGDSGASACDGNHNGSVPNLEVSDPASQPYATGVGGTHLNLAAAGSTRETVWNDTNLGHLWAGGGGVSGVWTMPSYQSAVLSPGTYLPCGASSCRAVPDIALDADVWKSPYVIYTCTSGPGCGSGGWSGWGGTSGAAPLMAGYTADINEYSIENGGTPLGFANPVLYSQWQSDPFLFRDVTVGNNDITGGSTWSAASGYDVATGLGSPDATELGIDTLDSSTQPTVTHVLASSPSVIKYGKQVLFSGTATVNGTPIANGLVWLVGHTSTGYHYWKTHTDSTGFWAFTLSTQINQRFAWYAEYQGTTGNRTSWTSTRTIAVIPRLSISAGLRRRSGSYHAALKHAFTLYFASSPAMTKTSLVLQARRRGGRWHTAFTAKTNRRGRISTRVYFSKTGRWYLRWVYHGGKRAPYRWASAVSPTAAFTVK